MTLHRSDVEITRPCPIDIRDQVRGATKRFHCSHCDLDVHVLSHMTPPEAARVLARRERESLCVAYFHDRAGNVRFAEQLIPPRRLTAPMRGLGASTLAMSLAACTPHSEKVPGPALDEQRDPSPAALVEELLSHPSGEPEDELTMGGIGGWEEPDEPDPIPERIPKSELVFTAGGIPGPGLPPSVLPDPTLLAGIAAPPKPKPRQRRKVPLSEVMTRAVYTPEPSARKLSRTRLARRDQTRTCTNTTSFCVTTQGRTTSVETARSCGDPEVDAIIRRTVETWRMKPSLDRDAAQLCTRQTFRVVFE